MGEGEGGGELPRFVPPHLHPLPRRGEEDFWEERKVVFKSSHHLVVDLDPAEWYFYKQEEAMIPKIFIGVLLGGAAGFGLSYLTRGIGSS